MNNAISKFKDLELFLNLMKEEGITSVKGIEFPTIIPNETTIMGFNTKFTEDYAKEYKSLLLENYKKFSDEDKFKTLYELKFGRFGSQNQWDKTIEYLFLETVKDSSKEPLKIQLILNATDCYNRSNFPYTKIDFDKKDIPELTKLVAKCLKTNDAPNMDILFGYLDKFGTFDEIDPSILQTAVYKFTKSKQFSTSNFYSMLKTLNKNKIKLNFELPEKNSVRPEHDGEYYYLLFSAGISFPSTQLSQIMVYHKAAYENARERFIADETLEYVKNPDKNKKNHIKYKWFLPSTLDSFMKYHQNDIDFDKDLDIYNLDAIYETFKNRTAQNNLTNSNRAKLGLIILKNPHCNIFMAKDVLEYAAMGPDITKKQTADIMTAARPFVKDDEKLIAKNNTDLKKFAEKRSKLLNKVQELELTRRDLEKISKISNEIEVIIEKQFGFDAKKDFTEYVNQALIGENYDIKISKPGLFANKDAKNAYAKKLSEIEQLKKLAVELATFNKTLGLDRRNLSDLKALMYDRIEQNRNDKNVTNYTIQETEESVNKTESSNRAIKAHGNSNNFDRAKKILNEKAKKDVLKNKELNAILYKSKTKDIE